MQVDDFIRVVDDLEFILEDLDELTAPISLSNGENNKLKSATACIESAKKTLSELFSSIKSLESDLRENLRDQLQ